MRFNIIYSDTRMTLIYRSHFARTLTEARELARESRRAVADHHNLEQWCTAEIESLALIPHPEEYQGPADPAWTRMLERLNDHALIFRVRDWIDGYVTAFDLIRRAALNMPPLLTVHQCDYHLVREMLISRGYEEALAQRIAMAATAPPHNWFRPALFGEPESI